jgi:PAS domain S-box-containing protein
VASETRAAWTSARRAVLLVLVAGLGILAASGWAAHEAIASGRWVEHTYEVIGEAEMLHRDLLRAEAEQRLSLATGAPFDLALRGALGRIDAGIARLLQLTDDNPQEQRRLHALQQRLTALAAFRERADAARRQGPEAVRALLDAPEEPVLRQAPESELVGLVLAERQLLLLRQQADRRAALLLWAVILTALLFGAGVSAWSLSAVRRSAQETEASEERFRALAEKSPDGVLVQAGGLVLYANEAAAALSGLRPAQLLGRPFLELIHPDDRENVGRRIASVLSEGRGNEPRLTRLLRPDGSTLEVEARSAPIRFNGKPALQVLVRDATERRRAELALQQSEERFRLLADHSGDLVSLRAPDLTFEYASPSHTSVLGWTPEELLAQPPFALMHPEDAARIRAVAQPTLLRGQRSEVSLNRVRHKQGHYVWLESHATPVLGPDGEVQRFIVAARDVTARRALEDELRQSQKMEAMGRMASGVAHDFNNLLTVIRSTVELWHEGGGPREGERDLLAAVERASALTAQLLAFSRRQHASPTLVSLPALLREARGLLDHLVAPGVRLEISVDEAAGPIAISTDPVLFERVLFHLLVNARDAMPGGGTVRLRCGAATLERELVHAHGKVPPGRYATLVVEDGGSGMSPEVLGHLFEPFYTTKPQGQGTGLGLATVFGIVQQAQGAITVDSELGRGSRFTVFWPRQVQEERAAAPASAKAPAAPLATPPRDPAADAVLVVDDEEGVRRVITRLLQQKGFRVVTADSGAAALALMKEQRSAVRAIVSDVRMPGMTGVQMVARLMDEGIHLPVLFVSGQLDAALPTDWPHTAERRFLAKPFSGEELLREVRGMLGSAPEGPPS